MSLFYSCNPSVSLNIFQSKMFFKKGVKKKDLLKIQFKFIPKIKFIENYIYT